MGSPWCARGLFWDCTPSNRSSCGGLMPSGWTKSRVGPREPRPTSAALLNASTAAGLNSLTVASTCTTHTVQHLRIESQWRGGGATAPSETAGGLAHDLGASTSALGIKQTPRSGQQAGVPAEAEARVDDFVTRDAFPAHTAAAMNPEAVASRSSTPADDTRGSRGASGAGTRAPPRSQSCLVIAPAYNPTSVVAV